MILPKSRVTFLRHGRPWYSGVCENYQGSLSVLLYSQRLCFTPQGDHVWVDGPVPGYTVEPYSPAHDIDLALAANIRIALAWLSRITEADLWAADPAVVELLGVTAKNVGTGNVANCIETANELIRAKKLRADVVRRWMGAGVTFALGDGGVGVAVKKYVKKAKEKP